LQIAEQAALRYPQLAMTNKAFLLLTSGDEAHDLD